MKKYTNPTLEELSVQTDNVITASASVNSIVSESDRSNADEIHVSDWNDSWN